MDFNVLNFGADFSGTTLTTLAVQLAIDECAKVGGRVIVPKGKYLIGTIRLKSNVELHLCRDARLIASDNLCDYNPLDEYEQNQGVSSEGWAGHHLIICVEQKNAAITGEGVIDGNSAKFFGEISVNPVFYPWRRGAASLTGELRPGQLLCFVESKNVELCGFTIQNAPCWSCFIHGCENVNISKIKINNPYYHFNTDGIDIDSSKHVRVSDCDVSVGDDAIAIRSATNRLKNKERVCEDVSVNRCTLSSNSSAIRLGVGTSEIRDVRISDIDIDYAGVAINFFPEWAGTSSTPIRNVEISDIRARNVGRMIELNVSSATPIENVRISNVSAEAMSAARLRCTSGGAVKNIRLDNVKISAIRDVCTKVSDAPEYRADSFAAFDGIEGLSLCGCSFFASEELLSQWAYQVNIDNCTVETIDYST